MPDGRDRILDTADALFGARGDGDTSAAARAKELGPLRLASRLPA